MSQWLPASEGDHPIGESTQLLEYFRQGAIGAAPRRVGIEVETVGVLAESGQAIPYDGPRSVRAVLEALQNRFGWTGQSEGDHLLGLERDGTRITLEPGGQIELSGRPFQRLAEVHAELMTVHRELAQVGESLGIGFLGLGFQPYTGANDIPLLPKVRYDIMEAYFQAHGGRRYREMMRQTASLQVTLDYRTLDEAAAMFRVAQALSPVFVALFANSPLADGAPTGYLSRRVAAWEETDPDRCGYLEPAFDPAFTLDDYVRFALDMPMMFRVVEGAWQQMDGRSFREWLEKVGPEQAWMSDWALHLSGSFLEVRLKQQIEVRSPDTQRADLAMAIPATWVGLLYSEKSRQAAWALLRDWSFQDRVRLHHDAGLYGLDASIGGEPLQGVASQLLALARTGLETLEPEAVSWLDPLEGLVANGLCPAHRVLAGWERGWASDPGRLVAANRFLPVEP